MKRLHATVSGRVQGVSFRYYTRRYAQRSGITGWVRNMEDGRVEVVAEGSEEALQSLVRFLWQGPPAARVDKVETEWSAARDRFQEFAIRW